MDGPATSSKESDVQTPSKKTARASRPTALPQNVKQQIFSWRLESSNIRKWNVTSPSQLQAQNPDQPPPTNTEPGINSEPTTQTQFLPQPKDSHIEEHDPNQSSSLPTGSSTPIKGQSPANILRRSDHFAENTTIPSLPLLETAERSSPDSRMSLVYITNPDIPKNVIEERLDRRRSKHRATQTHLINRNQPRQKRSLVDPRTTLPRLTIDSFYSDQRSLDSTNREYHLSLGPRLINTIDPLLAHGTPSVNRSLGSSTWDPFHTGTITLTPHMESVLMHYFTTILTTVEPMQAESEDFKSWAIPLTNTRPAMLYSLIASMAHDMEQSSLAVLRSPQRTNVVAEYRMKAIHFINECLADDEMAKDPSTLTAIHYLLWQEVRLISSSSPFSLTFFNADLCWRRECPLGWCPNTIAVKRWL